MQSPNSGSRDPISFSDTSMLCKTGIFSFNNAEAGGRRVRRQLRAERFRRQVDKGGTQRISIGSSGASPALKSSMSVWRVVSVDRAFGCILERCCLNVKNGFVLNFRIDHGNPLSPNRLYRIVNSIIYMTDIQ